MISKKETQEKVRNSVYWAPDTKLLVQRKSEELQLSQNRLTEICLQRYLPQMQWKQNDSWIQTRAEIVY